MKDLFRNQLQMKFFGLMCTSSLFCLGLVLMRIIRLDFDSSEFSSYENYLQVRGTSTFLFLVWNLFLAWIPYLVSILLPRINTHFNHNWITILLICVWLSFFPNAPYILTDLFHLKSRAPIPYWYDLVLILSFAWTGLMLGYFSLLEIQHFLTQKLSGIKAWALTIIFIGLAGFGVYLGRFLRWNSWDIITHPQGLIQDLLNIFIHPTSFSGAIGLTVVLSVFLLLGYLVLWIAIDQKQYKFNT